MQFGQDSIVIELKPGQKIYFASDFHLGAPSAESSLIREKKIIRWLDEIKSHAVAIFLVGDIFDFWFEYKYTIPKSFIRFQAKVLELREAGISVHFFTGNHDMWMFDYFTEEFNIPIHRKPMELLVSNTKMYIGHGDGLGSGDHFYKFLKKVFSSPFFQWIFRWVHPNISFKIATIWSRHSRVSKERKEDASSGKDEWIFQYCEEIEKIAHHDLYIFGHRHLPMQASINSRAKYFNLGEWVHHCTYLEFDGNEARLKSFSK